MDLWVLAIYGGLLLLLLGCIIAGYLRGFIKTILSIAAVVLCVMIAREYCAPVAAWLNQTYVHPAIVDAVTDALNTHLAEGTQAAVNAVPAGIVQLASLAGVSVASLVESAAAAADVPVIAERIAAAAEQTMLGGLLRVAAFVALFLLLRLLAAILIAVIDSVFKLPVLKTLNRSVGGVLGALKGVVLVLICILGLAAAAQMMPETTLAQAFAQSGLGAVSDTFASLI